MLCSLFCRCGRRGAPAGHGRQHDPAAGEPGRALQQERLLALRLSDNINEGSRGLDLLP